MCDRTRKGTALMALLLLTACEGDSLAPRLLDVSFSTAEVQLTQGDSVAVPVVIDRNGVTGPLGITISLLPHGVTASVSEVAADESNAVIMLRARADATPGPGVMTIRGATEDRTYESVSIPVMVSVRGSFTLDVPDDTIFVPRAGLSATSSVSVLRSNGFGGTVQLTAEAPSGIGIVVGPLVALGTQASSLRVDVGAGVLPGSYPILIRGATVGLGEQTTQVILRVDPAGPYLLINQANPGGATVIRGGTSAIRIGFERGGGYAGPATPVAVSAPPGITVGFTAGPTSDSALVVITAAPSLAEGIYIVVIGTDNPGVRNARSSVMVSVTAGSMRTVSLTQQIAVVNQVVAQSPRVQVLDRAGRGVPLVLVTFRANGGSVADTVAYTDAAGIATPGTWRTGTVAMPYTVLASAAGVGSILFQAAATAGPPALMSTVQGDGQSFRLSHALAIRPQVLITDEFDNPVRNVPVTFTPAARSGRADPSTTITDFRGIAETIWIVSDEQIVQTMQASSPGLPTTIFSAYPITMVCTSRAFTIGAVLEGILNYYSSCPQPAVSESGDAYVFTLAQTTRFRITPIGSGYYYYDQFNVWILDAAGAVLLPPNMLRPSYYGSYVITLPAGTYTMLATVEEFGGAGYTIRTEIPAAGGCHEITIPARYPVDGVIDGQDCAVVLGRYDAFRVYLAAGQPVTVSAAMSNAGVLEINTGGGSTIATPVSTTPSLTFTPAVSGSYSMRLYNPVPSPSTTYTLRIQSP